MMEFKKPKPKKTAAPQGKVKLPPKKAKEIVGVFNGHFVTVRDLDSMIYLYETGNFGKGSLSKGEPNYCLKKDDIPKIILQHQFDNQIKWNANSSCFHSQIRREYVKNDYELSLESINRFLQSSFIDNDQESWKSWKKSHERECQNLDKKGCQKKKELTLLGFNTDETDYNDEDFRGTVNNILQSKQMKKPNASSSKTNEVIVLDTSFNSQAGELSALNINARFEKLPFMAVENLNLNLEEAFFLKSVSGCLNVVDLNFSEIGISDLWEKFNLANKNFMERYITYHYYRTKGWIVRSGLKFGGDYLLYKDGPACYHASYLVKVLDRRKKLTWKEFLCMNRLVETFNKDLLLSNVLLAGEEPGKKTYPNALESHTVQEILVKRWFPSRERFSKMDEVQS